MYDMNEDVNELWEYRDAITERVSIIMLAKEYGIALEDKASGQEFSHRARCPFHVGKGSGGVERTPSFYLSDRTNSFCCFGCGRAGSVIDFVCYSEGTPPIMALKKLAKHLGIINDAGKWDELQLDSLKKYVKDSGQNKNIEPHLFDIGHVMRSYIARFIGTERFDKELVWIDKVGNKVDEFLANIGHEDWEYAQDLFNKVKQSIDKRLKKIGEIE